MLIRLASDQVARYWDFIKDGLEEALPPVVGMQPERMSNILTAIMVDEITVWLSVEETETANEITGFIATSLNTDKPSGTKSLLLYAVYGVMTCTDKSWSEGLKAMKKYAKTEGCHRIVAYSDVPSIIKYVERIGGEAKYRLLSIPL